MQDAAWERHQLRVYVMYLLKNAIDRHIIVSRMLTVDVPMPGMKQDSSIRPSRHYLHQYIQKMTQARTF